MADAPSYESLLTKLSTGKKSSGSGGGFSGLLGDIGSQVLGIPEGLYNLAKSGASDLADVTRLPATVQYGGLRKLGIPDATAKLIGQTTAATTPGLGTLANTQDIARQVGISNPQTEAFTPKPELLNYQPGESVLQSVSRMTNQEIPTLRTFLWNSPGNTLGRLGATAKAIGTGNFSQIPYVQAWNRGDLASQIVEDAANASLAGGLAAGGLRSAAGAAGEASKAAEAARGAEEAGTAHLPPPPGAPTATALGTRLAPYSDQLLRAAEKVGTVSEVGNKVAGAPLKPFTYPFQAGARYLALGDLADLPSPPGLRGQLTRADQAIGRATSGIMRRAQEHAQTVAMRGMGMHGAAAGAAQETQPWSQAWTDVGSHLSDGERNAMMNLPKVDPNSFAAIRAAVDNAPDDLTKLARLEQLAPDISPQGYEVLKDYFTPAGQPATVGAGVGTAKTPIQALQAAPSDTKVKLDEAWQQIMDQGGINPRAEQRLANWGASDKSTYTPEWRQAEQGTAPMEPAIQRDLATDKGFQRLVGKREALTGQSGAEAQLADVQRQIDEKLATMRDDLQYAPPDRRGAILANIRVTEGLTKLAEDADPTTAALFQEHANQVATTLSEMNRQGVDQPGRLIYGLSPEGTYPPKAGLAVRRLSSERFRGQDRADTTFEGQFKRIAADQLQRHQNEFNRGVAEQYGSRFDSADAAKAAGFEPVPGLENTYVPKQIAKGMRQAAELKVKMTNEWVRAYDKGINVTKVMFLPLNPRWNVANLFGNMLMGASEVGAGQMAEQFPRAIREALDLRKGKLPRSTAHAELMRRGPTADLQGLFTEPPKGGVLRRAGRKVVETAYDMNQVIDDATHIAVFEGVKAQGAQLGKWADSEIAAGRMTRSEWDRLKVKSNVTDQQAMDRALKVAGDFTNMSPFEKNIIKRMSIFYPWYKHITKLMFRLPLEHPYRVAWTLHLADLMSNNEDRPIWLQSAIQVGDTYYQVPVNPFPGTETIPVNPQQALATASPFIQWPAAAFGYNLGRSRLVTMPPGTYPVDQYGREQPGNWIGLGSPTGGGFLGYMAGQLPQVRLARDVTQGNYARYDTGEPLVRQGQLVRSSAMGGRAAPLVTWATGVTAQQPNLQEQAAIEAKRRTSRLKRRKSYESSLRKATG